MFVTCRSFPPPVRRVLPTLAVLGVAIIAMLTARTSAASPPSDATVRASLIQRTYFGSNRVRSVREAGYVAIRQVNDAATLLALARELKDERDDVRGVLLEHLGASGDAGEAILAWLAITDGDARLRGAAARMLAVPASPAATGVIRRALTRGSSVEIDRAAELAAWIEAVDVIPQLVSRLSTTRIVPVRGDGGGLRRVPLFEGVRTFALIDTDLLAPETIPQSPELLPGLGGISGGVSLGRGSIRQSYRRIDSPRPAVHRSLLALARLAHGPAVPDLGIDQQAWWRWLSEVSISGPPRP